MLSQLKEDVAVEPKIGALPPASLDAGRLRVFLLSQERDFSLSSMCDEPPGVLGDYPNLEAGSFFPLVLRSV